MERRRRFCRSDRPNAASAPGAREFWPLTRFTVWVRDEARASTHVDVYDATDVAEAIQQALEKVSQEWRCVPDRLTVLGIAEGDVTMKGE